MLILSASMKRYLLAYSLFLIFTTGSIINNISLFYIDEILLSKTRSSYITIKTIHIYDYSFNNAQSASETPLRASLPLQRRFPRLLFIFSAEGTDSAASRRRYNFRYIDHRAEGKSTAVSPSARNFR